jgi:germination protein M
MKKIKINILTFLVLILLGILLISLTSCTRSVSLYFGYDTGTEAKLAEESREITADENIYKTCIEELIKGPESSGLYPTIPSNVRVNLVKVSDGTATVDFSKEIITNFEEIPHSSTTEVLAIYSIVNTLTEFEEINKVQITVEGKDTGEIDGLYVEDFWGHVGIYEDFERNEDIIYKEQ